MQWLPSFVKLFLLAVLGLVLQLGGGIAMIAVSGYWPASVFQALSLVGTLLLIVSPVLMLLKFFARLDRRA